MVGTPLRHLRTRAMMMYDISALLHFITTYCYTTYYYIHCYRTCAMMYGISAMPWLSTAPMTWYMPEALSL